MTTWTEVDDYFTRLFPHDDVLAAAHESSHHTTLPGADVKPGDLHPCLDFETMGSLTKAQSKTWIRNFCKEVKRQTGVEPVIYLPGDWDLEDACPNSIIWRPRYSNANTPPLRKCHIRQFSNGVYGVPSVFPGLGAVDLNHLNGLTMVKDFTIPKPVKATAPKPTPAPAPKPKPTPAPKPATAKPVKWTFGFLGLDFRTTVKQRKMDINHCFERASDKKMAAIFGTEGWESETRTILRAVATAYGYRFYGHPATDAWIAVRSDLVHGKWDTFWKQAIKGTAGHNTAKGPIGVSFYNSRVGDITLMPGHLLTKGRTNSKDTEYRKNIAANTKIMAAYALEMKTRAAGNKIGFIGMDFNQLDNLVDVMYGEPFTTAADQLKKYPKTHAAGPIDGFAKWDADKRVKFLDVRFYNDNRFQLHTDHFWGECDVEIQPVKKK